MGLLGLEPREQPGGRGAESVAAHTAFLRGLGPRRRQNVCMEMAVGGAEEMAWKMSLLGICSSSFVGVDTWCGQMVLPACRCRETA